MTSDQLNSYDHILVMYSGGKDSTACFLQLLEMNVDLSKVELWHHDIDGRDKAFMDWSITPDYCKKFAAAFGVPIYFSWKVGGFEREMNRENAKTAPNCFETPEGEIITVGGKTGKDSTRKKFPQISPDLSVRWCSAYLKMDVAKAAINNQERFRGKRVLVISGERGEESANRSRYEVFQPHETDLRNGKRYTRHVDRWRIIKEWTEQQVWAIIEKYCVRVHPAYYIGFGRVSCMFCIFGNKNQFASAYYLCPSKGDRIIAYEEEFGVTIKRKETLTELINKGIPYDAIDKEPENAALAVSQLFNVPIIMQEGEWYLPSGAYGESCGPV